MVKVDSNKHMRPPTCRRIVWVAYAKFCTLLVPDKLLIFISNNKFKTRVRRKAWREKVALFITYIIICALFCFWLEFITALFCSPRKTYSSDEVFTNSSGMSGINGDAIDWSDYGNATDMTFFVNDNTGYDLSPMFPLFMQLERPQNQAYFSDSKINNCMYASNKSTQADNWLNYHVTHDPGYVYENNRLVSCPLPGNRFETGSPCFYSDVDNNDRKKYGDIGVIEYDKDRIRANHSALPYSNSTNSAYVILYGDVLDVTDYLLSATNIVKVAKGSHSRAFALDRMYLPLDLTILLFTKTGTDITEDFQNIKNANIYRECLPVLFKHGVVDVNKATEGCARINLALWITMGCFLLYFLLKMNLANLSRLPWIQRILFKSVATISSQRYLPPFILMFIPCYAESSETIRQTFDSLARNNYPDTRKLLFFVCDGLAQSKSDNKETYLCILESLGYSSTIDPEIRSYISLGQGTRRINYAKVYAGFYESGRNRVPFLMIVKVGSSIESTDENDDRAPGNRGKRDSMVIVLSFLERCMNLSHHRINPLEFELFNQCYNLLGIDPRQLKYMLATDADVQVQDDVLTRLVSRLEADPKLLAINGHIRPANPEENIITMLQIFPAYMTFYSSLAFEACLGGVTTINGGFIMYRLWSEITTTTTTTTTTNTNTNTNTNINTTSVTTNNYKMQSLDHLSPRLAKWPKVSDEIVIPEQSTIVDWKTKHEEEMDDTSSDDNFSATNTTTSSRNKTNSSRRRMFTKTKKLSPVKRQESERHLSLVPNKNAVPICIQPTVLRGFAAPKPETMHMENVLLLGEEQYFSIVLLRSHPNHHIGFEPEAIAYATIPTNFFALQALQTRNIRSAFNNQLEFQHVAKHLGFMYWIMSMTKLLDTIFMMPIIVYLYGIFIRFFRESFLAYGIIALSFTALLALHIFYFIIRRQFKYVLWFIIYCLFSVPIFNIYFPLLAIWCSDKANRWYDVWPTQKGFKSRLHGIVQDTDLDTKEEEEDAEDAVIRMRLSDFEVLEAERLAQREKEQVEMLDAKFNGFTSYVASHASKPSWSSANDFMISSPPMAQMRDGLGKIKSKTHSRLTSEDDTRFLLTPNRSSTPRTLSMNSSNSTHIISNNMNSPRDPFTSALDNPFDDVYDLQKSAVITHHKPSHSQSSYFSRSSMNVQDMFAPPSEDDSFTTNTHRMRSFSASAVRPAGFNHNYSTSENILKDTSSIISLSNSVISLERDAPPPIQHDNIEPPPTNYSGRRRFQQSPQEEGRSAPVHSRFVFH